MLRLEQLEPRDCPSLVAVTDTITVAPQGETLVHPITLIANDFDTVGYWAIDFTGAFSIDPNVSVRRLDPDGSETLAVQLAPGATGGSFFYTIVNLDDGQTATGIVNVVAGIVNVVPGNGGNGGNGGHGGHGGNGRGRA
jgi:hypothetical protein